MVCRTIEVKLSESLIFTLLCVPESYARLHVLTVVSPIRNKIQFDLNTSTTHIMDLLMHLTVRELQLPPCSGHYVADGPQPHGTTPIVEPGYGDCWSVPSHSRAAISPQVAAYRSESF
jgi:hypothetical protein